MRIVSSFVRRFADAFELAVATHKYEQRAMLDLHTLPKADMLKVSASRLLNDAVADIERNGLDLNAMYDLTYAEMKKRQDERAKLHKARQMRKALATAH